MEDKKTVQDAELSQVTGGVIEPGTYLACDKCGKKYYERLPYPDGFFVSMEWHGCYQHYKFKCPSCGHEWNTVA